MAFNSTHGSKNPAAATGNDCQSSPGRSCVESGKERSPVAPNMSPEL